MEREWSETWWVGRKIRGRDLQCQVTMVCDFLEKGQNWVSGTASGSELNSTSREA